jgi:UMF1 family MFS transporter
VEGSQLATAHDDANNEERRRVRAWQMYDWANSAFATTIIAGLLPIYFASVATAGLTGKASSAATALWGLTAAISMILVAVAALLLGPASDALARKKRFLGGFLALGATATALLAFSPPSWWWMLAGLFIVGNLGFAGANIFYDSLLPAVARPERLDQVSSQGYAMGYLGGGLQFALCVGLIFLFPHVWKGGEEGGADVLAMRAAFVLTALWWVLFSIPLFRRVPEPSTGASIKAATAIAVSLGRLRETVRDLRSHREAWKFLLAFWLFSDGVGTIIKMAAVYGKEIFRDRERDPTPHLLGALLLVQFVGIPCTLFWGRAAQRIGAKASVLICLGVYGVLCLLGYFMTEIWQFYALALGVGLVQGGTQALSRSMFAVLAPKGREAEFFGFYNISGKFAGVLGPLLFAAVSWTMGSSQLAILSLVIFFALGGAILATVRMPEPEKQK